MSEAAPEAAPLFTIITVCKNAEASIRRTIESVLAQEVPGLSIEHEIVDGGSSDGTLRLLAHYPHLRVTSEPDRGLYDAMNKGIARARGQYIGILNADDWYEPHALSCVASEFEIVREAGIVHGDVRRWTRGRPLDVVRPPLAGLPRASLLLPVNHPATFVRRSVYSEVGLFNVSYRSCADYDWVKRAQKADVTFQYCPRVLVNFSMGGISTRRFLLRERYRSRRVNGAGRLASMMWLLRTSAVILRNRWHEHALADTRDIR